MAEGGSVESAGLRIRKTRNWLAYYICTRKQDTKTKKTQTSVEVGKG
jgi:hypothetical protein